MTVVILTTKIGGIMKRIQKLKELEEYLDKPVKFKFDFILSIALSSIALIIITISLTHSINSNPYSNVVLAKLIMLILLLIFQVTFILKSVNLYAISKSYSCVLKFMEIEIGTMDNQILEGDEEDDTTEN